MKSVVKGTPTQKMVLAALMIALCLLLPFLTAQIPSIGSALSPMHIPVLLCGFVCGPFYGAVVGFVSPLLRSFIFGMPPLFPTATAMALELATYGFVAGVAYALLHGKKGDVIISLLIAMITGRIVWGIARLIFAGIAGTKFTFAAFIAGAFTNAIPGIVCHIILIPVIVYALRKAKLIA